MKEIKAKFNKNIWLYTGFTIEEIQNWVIGPEILSYIDVLVDGEFILEERDTNLHWVGSPNQRIIDVQKTLKENKIIKHCEVFYENYKREH